MTKQTPADTLVFGCGYLGRRVAQQLISQGNRVWGVTRSHSKAEQLEQLGILPIIADWTDPETLQSLPHVQQILVSVSYDSHSRHDRHESQVGGLRNLLQHTSPVVNLCYISTTGVYGQSDGDWVDESSPCQPRQPGGKTHMAAEQLLHEMRPADAWTILRLSGIYGPGRIPRVADVIAGRPIESPQDGYLNLIHVDDAAAIVISVWKNSRQRIYLVSDDRPVIRGDFYREVARQFGAPQPTFVDPSPNAPVSMRATSNKRVSNRKMKTELMPTLMYPTFHQGIRNAVG